MMSRRSVFASILVLAACGAKENDGPGVSHTFPAITVEPGAEIPEICQSWRIENASTLYVNTIGMSSGAGFHHGNWYHVPEEMYDGPDGTFDCASRDFIEPVAAVSGGVLYGQSTQAREETLSFADGAVIPIPPRSRIVGSVHLLNTTEARIDSEITLDLRLIPADQVEARMSPIVFLYHALDIPEQSESTVRADCDMQEIAGGPVDLSIYYASTHYHALGRGARVTALGTDQVFFDERQAIGETLGRSYDPPARLEGVSGLRFECHFDNPRDERVGWGIGDQEMCGIALWTDASGTWVGGVAANIDEATAPDGTKLVTGNCGMNRFDAPQP